jgi:Ras-related protein Rab-37
MLQVMTTDDSMSDDVFESPEDMAMTEGERGSYGTKYMNVMSVPGQHTTPSPTGYRDYKPPAEVLKMYEQQQEEAEQAVHKVGHNYGGFQVVSWLSRNALQRMSRR